MWPPSSRSRGWDRRSCYEPASRSSGWSGDPGRSRLPAVWQPEACSSPATTVLLRLLPHSSLGALIGRGVGAMTGFPPPGVRSHPVAQVPPEDARVNLERMITHAKRLSIPVLLVSEVSRQQGFGFPVEDDRGDTVAAMARTCTARHRLVQRALARKQQECRILRPARVVRRAVGPGDVHRPATLQREGKSACGQAAGASDPQPLAGPKVADRPEGSKGSQTGARPVGLVGREWPTKGDG